MAHILVVDDDVMILKVVQAALLKLGHSVVAVRDGYEAAEKLSDETFQLLISDVNMPGGVSGFSLVATARHEEKHQTLPIIFMTGRNDKSDVVRALKVGVDDYIIKPIDIESFMAKVQVLLKRKPQGDGFVETTLRIPAKAAIEFEISAIAAHGVQLLSSVNIPINSQFEITSRIFADIHIAAPTVKVSGCSFANGTYIVVAGFVNMPVEDQQKYLQLLSQSKEMRKKGVA